MYAPTFTGPEHFSRAPQVGGSATRNLRQEPFRCGIPASRSTRRPLPQRTEGPVSAYWLLRFSKSRIDCRSFGPAFAPRSCAQSVFAGVHSVLDATQTFPGIFPRTPRAAVSRRPVQPTREQQYVIAVCHSDAPSSLDGSSIRTTHQSNGPATHRIGAQGNTPMRPVCQIQHIKPSEKKAGRGSFVMM